MADFNTNYVNWNGVTEQSTPYISTDAEDLVWQSVDFTWDDVQLIGKISSLRRGKELDDYLIKNPNDKKKLIRLICSVKGIEVYSEQKEVQDTKIDIRDIDLLIKEAFGRMTIE